MNNNKRHYDGFYITEDEMGFGEVLLPTNSWRDSFRSFMEHENIPGLRLSDSAGWRPGDMGFVANLRDLKAFELYHYGTLDVPSIHLLKNLEYIGLECGLKSKIDFSQFPKLSICQLTWNKKCESIFQCQHLTHLNMSKYPFEDLKPLRHMEKLEKLQLTSHKLKTLDGIQSLKNLKVLDLYMCVKLEDLKGVSLLPVIEKVEIESCKKVHDITEFAGLEALREFYIPNCGKLKSIAPLKNCHNLTRLFFNENTTIEDGDMSHLLEMQSLEQMAFTNRRHYTHTYEQIWSAMMRAKHPQMR